MSTSVGRLQSNAVVVANQADVALRRGAAARCFLFIAACPNKVEFKLPVGAAALERAISASPTVAKVRFGVANRHAAQEERRNISHAIQVMPVFCVGNLSVHSTPSNRYIASCS